MPSRDKVAGDRGEWSLDEDRAKPDGAALAELLRSACARGDTAALLDLAYRLSHGVDAPRDLAAAIECLTQAAGLGSPEAMYNLALCYLRGLGVKMSLARSRQWMAACEEKLGIETSTGAAAVVSIPPRTK